MLRFFTVLSGLVVLTAPLATAQPDSLDRVFRSGNEAYQAGRYAESIEAYRSVIAAGFASAELYYNLGNAYFRAGKVGQAIRYYEKARRLRPSDPRLQHNLEQARERVHGAGTGASVPSWRPWVASGSPFVLWAVALALLTAAGAVAVVRSARSSSASPWRHPAVGGLVAAGLFVGAGAMVVSFLQEAEHRAVVVARNAPIRLDPQRTAIDTSLPEGTLVRLVPSSASFSSASSSSASSSSGGDSTWIRLHLPDGSTGWAPTDSLGRID